MARKRQSNSPLATIDRPLFYGGPDPITLNRMEAMVANVTSLQRERLAVLSNIDPRRNLNKECGYPEREMSAEEYKQLIGREPAAAFVNNFYPLESWKSEPTIKETSDSETETEFEAARRDLPKMMGVEPSYLNQGTGDPLNFFLLTADMLSGYGRFGLIVFYFEDGKELSEPVTPKQGMRLTGVRAYPENLVRVNSYEMDRRDPLSRLRYGQPTTFTVRNIDSIDNSPDAFNEPDESVFVHWSRTIMLTDRWHYPSSSKVFAKPRVSPYQDQCLDIRKTRGSSAEMFYKGGLAGHHFGTHPQLGADVDVDIDALRDMYEEYQNGIQRAIWTSGMQLDDLAPQVSDPTPQILVQMQSICLGMRVPFRIAIGNETGERSTTEDLKKHKGNLVSRNNTYLTPMVIGPFYNKLINVGVLPVPKKGFNALWPKMDTMTALEKADVLLKRTQSYSAYAQGMSSVVQPIDYMTKYDDVSEDEAQQMLQTSVDANDGNGEQVSPLIGMVGGVDAMLQMFDQFANGAISEETLKQLIMLFYKVDETKATEIIADGLPEPPKGSPRDLPPLPPMIGPKGKPAKPVSNSRIVLNWLKTNIFCPTGEGGGVDPTCSPSQVKGISLLNKRPEGWKEKRKLAKGIKDEDAKIASENLIQHRETFAKGFREHVEFLTQQEISQMPGNLKGLKDRVEIVKLFVALDSHTEAEATKLAKTRLIEGQDRGASAGHNVGEKDIQHGWEDALKHAGIK